MRKPTSIRKYLRIRQRTTKDHDAADVVIIGGGMTGIGIARDAAERGLKVVLVERHALGSGTSGNFHGLLHSGCRYVVNDPETAKACFEENQIIRRIAPGATLDTGGFFVSLNQSEADYSDKFLKACNNVAIPVRDVPLSLAIQQEPSLTRQLERVIAVPDAYVNGVELIRLNMRAARTADTPARILTHHEVVGFGFEKRRISSVKIRDANSGGLLQIDCGFVINAAGIWAGRVAALAGITIDMTADKGSMLVFDERLTRAVLNRCRPEDNGDILVPTGKYSIMGTTSQIVKDFDKVSVTKEEKALLLAEGEALVPGLKSARIRYEMAGVRPLFSSGGKPSTVDGRKVKRSFQVLDHEEEGISNFLSVVGGKVTLYRAMAEKAVDLLCKKQGKALPCHTAGIPLSQSAASRA